MIFQVGQTVVYPHRGPCRVGAIIKKVVGGYPEKFYPLVVMDESGDVLFLPVHKAASVGVRELVNRSEIPQVLFQLGHAAKPESQNRRTNWKERAAANRNLLASNSPFDLATLVASLSQNNAEKKLAPADREVLDKARKQLICEISQVTGDSKNSTARHIDSALNMNGKAVV